MPLTTDSDGVLLSGWRKFFSGKTFVGEYPISILVRDNEILFDRGEAFFCPVCGEVWGRSIPTPDVAIPLKPLLWSLQSRRCERHGDGYFLVGQNHKLATCTTGLLHREALLLILNHQKVN